MAKPFVHLLLDGPKSGKQCIKETIFVCIPCIEYTLEESFASFLTFLSICVCNACVYACVRVSARLQGKREGWAFILLLPVLLEQIYRLSIALRYPALIGTPINELFNVFIVRFSNFSSNVIFFYAVRNRSVKYILIVPRYRKNIVGKRKEKGKKRGMFIIV